VPLSIQLALPPPLRLQLTFGEFAAYTTLACQLIQFALGMAVVARGFSTFLAALLNLQPSDVLVTVEGGEHSFDFVAAGIVLLMSALLSLGVREGAHFNAGGQNRGGRKGRSGWHVTEATHVARQSVQTDVCCLIMM